MAINKAKTLGKFKGERKKERRTNRTISSGALIPLGMMVHTEHLSIVQQLK